MARRPSRAAPPRPPWRRRQPSAPPAPVTAPPPAKDQPLTIRVSSDTWHFLAAQQRWRDRSPEERLRWVLDFLDRDLATLYPEERAALGYDLAGVATTGSRMTTLGRRGPLSEASLRAYQQRLAGGLRALMAGPARTWVLPGRPELLYEGGRDGFRLSVYGDETKEGLLLGIAELLVAVGRKLRRCLDCGKLFVAVRRQTFCTPVCSQRQRNQRKKLRGAELPATAPPRPRARQTSKKITTRKAERKGGAA